MAIQKEVEQLSAELADLLKKIGYDQLEQKNSELKGEMERPDFWSDNARAQSVSKAQAKLASRLMPWQKLKQEIAVVSELAQLEDTSLEAEIEQQLSTNRQVMEGLKQELKFSGTYDDHDVVMTIQAGAGGTDDQDLAEMLLRMYLRYAEKVGWKADIVDQSAGDEAGIKSATIEFSGDFAYGKLKGEHGVHRLVRLSPFNSAASRETSFAAVEVVPKIDEPSEVEIDPKDLKIDVYRSGGHGGQSVNTTDSAVRITHLPTGISVAIQNERSQLQNREVAMSILRSKLAQLALEQHADKISELKPPTGANEFGSQIRNYVLHPYKQVKDLRTGYQSSDPSSVLGGDLDSFIESYLNLNLSTDE
jgi:peptide chain release factor 2